MSSMPMAMSRTAEWCWVCLAFLLLNMAYASGQPVDLREGRGYDGQIYHAMAKAMPRELPPPGVAPFVYRIGMPLVAAGLAKSQDWVITAGFDRLNLALNAVSVILLTLLLQRHVTSVFARVVVIVAFMVEPHSPLRLSYVHPLSTDPAALAGLLAGLTGIDWFQSRPGRRRAALLAVLVAIGVTFHEVMLVVGVCVLVSAVAAQASGQQLRPAGWRGPLVALLATGAWIPLASGIAALAVVHAWVVPTPSDYSVSAEVLRWFREKSFLQYGLSWFLVFGPLLMVPAFCWRSSAGFLRERPVFLAYLSMCAGLAWLGGGQTERLLALASPVVYTLIARALIAVPIGPASVAMAGIVLAQGLSSRVFSPIGGPIEPPVVRTEVWERLGSANVAWGLSYQNMWSQLCAPAMIDIYLLWYGITAAGLLALLWYRTRGTGRSEPLTTPEVA